MVKTLTSYLFGRILLTYLFRSPGRRLRSNWKELEV